MRPRNLTRLALAASMLAAVSPPARAESWNTYTNARFLYQICYPPDLLVPQRESDNGDGRQFTSSTGATLRVWGTYNAAEDSLASLTGQLAADLAGPAGPPATQKTTGTASVVSGTNGQQSYFAEVVLDKDAVHSFILTYPTAQAGIFAPVSARLATCFLQPPGQ